MCIADDIEIAIGHAGLIATLAESAQYHVDNRKAYRALVTSLHNMTTEGVLTLRDRFPPRNARPTPFSHCPCLPAETAGEAARVSVLEAYYAGIAGPYKHDEEISVVLVRATFNIVVRIGVLADDRGA